MHSMGEGRYKRDVRHSVANTFCSVSNTETRASRKAASTLGETAPRRNPRARFITTAENDDRPFMFQNTCSVLWIVTGQITRNEWTSRLCEGLPLRVREFGTDSPFGQCACRFAATMRRERVPAPVLVLEPRCGSCSAEDPLPSFRAGPA